MEKKDLTPLREFPITTYLESIGLETPKKIGNEFVYSSPFTNERTPSFFVNPKKNVFTDYSSGEKGGIFNLIQKLEKITFPEAIKRLDELVNGNPTVAHTFNNQHSKEEVEKEKAIEITSVNPLTTKSLVDYVTARGIDMNIAKAYLKEVRYRNLNNGKQYFSIGFANDSGGYELRNAFFKNKTSNDITFIDKGTKEVNIFEGFFDFLSALTYAKNSEPTVSTIILNSTINIDLALKKIGTSQRINSYLDNDKTGESTLHKLQASGFQVADISKQLFPNFNDFNDFLINKPQNTIKMETYNFLMQYLNVSPDDVLKSHVFQGERLFFKKDTADNWQSRFTPTLDNTVGSIQNTVEKKLNDMHVLNQIGENLTKDDIYAINTNEFFVKIEEILQNNGLAESKIELEKKKNETIQEKFDIGYHSLSDGTGTEIYNRANVIEIGKDKIFQSLAIVDEEGNINYLVKGLPINIKNEIAIDVASAFQSFQNDKKEGEKFDFGRQFEKDIFREYDATIRSQGVISDTMINNANINLDLERSKAQQWASAFPDSQGDLQAAFENDHYISPEELVDVMDKNLQDFDEQQAVEQQEETPEIKEEKNETISMLEKLLDSMGKIKEPQITETPNSQTLENLIPILERLAVQLEKQNASKFSFSDLDTKISNLLTKLIDSIIDTIINKPIQKITDLKNDTVQGIRDAKNEAIQGVQNYAVGKVQQVEDKLVGKLESLINQLNKTSNALKVGIDANLKVNEIQKKEAPKNELLLSTDKSNINEYLENLNSGKFSNEIGKLLIDSPVLIDKINPIVLERMEVIQITYVLAHQPQLADKLSLEKLDGNDISLILGTQPDLVDKLDLKKMDEFDIRHVLEMQPQLVDKLDTNKLNGDSIAYVLAYQPKLVDKLDTGKMNVDEITNVLHNQPELLSKLNVESTLNASEKEQLMNNLPSLKTTLDGTNTEIIHNEKPLTIKEQIIETLDKWGITAEFLAKPVQENYPNYTILDALANGERSPLMTISKDVNGVKIDLEGRIRVKIEDGIAMAGITLIQKELQIPNQINGFVFTDEHKRNLKEVGILGELAEFETKNGKEKYFVSVDKETNTLVSMKENVVKIPDQLLGVKLSDQDKKDLKSGGIVRLEGATKGEKIFNTCVFVDADKRKLSFSNSKEIQQKTTQKETVVQKKQHSVKM